MTKYEYVGSTPNGEQIDMVRVRYGTILFRFFRAHSSWLEIVEIAGLNKLSTLAASLGKWLAIEAILKSTSLYIYDDGGTASCALCQRFRRRAGALQGDCGKCPVVALTGEVNCSRTPYMDFDLVAGQYPSQIREAQIDATEKILGMLKGMGARQIYEPEIGLYRKVL